MKLPQDLSVLEFVPRPILLMEAGLLPKSRGFLDVMGRAELVAEFCVESAVLQPLGEVSVGKPPAVEAAQGREPARGPFEIRNLAVVSGLVRGNPRRGW